LLVKRIFLFVLNAALAMAILDLISMYILLRLLSCSQNSWNITHSPFVYGIKRRFTHKCTKYQKRMPEIISVYFVSPPIMKMRHG
jgi:hypothetical protein